jgi:hypothetical protein
MMCSNRFSIHPNLSLTMDAAKDKPRNLALPIGWNRQLLSIPARTGIDAEQFRGFRFLAQSAQTEQLLLFD